MRFLVPLGARPIHIGDFSHQIVSRNSMESEHDDICIVLGVPIHTPQSGDVALVQYFPIVPYDYPTPSPVPEPTLTLAFGKRRP